METSYIFKVVYNRLQKVVLLITIYGKHGLHNISNICMIIAVFAAHETCITYSKKLAKDHYEEDKCAAMIKFHPSMNKRKVMKSINILYHKETSQSKCNVFLQQCSVVWTGLSNLKYYVQN